MQTFDCFCVLTLQNLFRCWTPSESHSCVLCKEDSWFLLFRCGLFLPLLCLTELDEWTSCQLYNSWRGFCSYLCNNCWIHSELFQFLMFIIPIFCLIFVLLRHISFVALSKQTCISPVSRTQLEWLPLLFYDFLSSVYLGLVLLWNLCLKCTLGVVNCSHCPATNSSFFSLFLHILRQVHFVVRTCLKLKTILLPQFPKYWDYRCKLSHLTRPHRFWYFAFLLVFSSNELLIALEIVFFSYP